FATYFLPVKSVLQEALPAAQETRDGIVRYSLLRPDKTGRLIVEGRRLAIKTANHHQSEFCVAAMVFSLATFRPPMPRIASTIIVCHSLERVFPHPCRVLSDNRKRTNRRDFGDISTDQRRE